MSSAPNYNSTVTIENTTNVAFTGGVITSVVGGTPVIPATIDAGRAGEIFVPAEYAVMGSGGHIRYTTTNAGNTIYISVIFSCNNNSTSVTTNSTNSSIRFRETSGSSSVSPLKVTYHVVAA